MTRPRPDPCDTHAFRDSVHTGPDPVRVGVIGVGSLGEHHLRIYADLPGARLIGLYDTDPERASAMAQRYGTRVFASLPELAEQIDAASVVVPTDTHRDVAGALIEKGLHLLVEKPIAATSSEAEALVEAAQERGLILQVGHIERFNPVLKVLENQSGPPRFIEAHRLAPYPAARKDSPPRGTEVSVVLDLMIHDIEVIFHLVRAPVSDIKAVGVPVLSPSEDIANVRLAFENGCVANLTSSRISPEKMRKIRVFYDDAYVSLDYMNQSGTLHRRTERGIERELLPIARGEPLHNELAAFVDCVARRSEPVVSGRQAAEALTFAVRIMRHMRRGSS